MDNIKRDLLCLSDIEMFVERGEFPIVIENPEEDLEIENPVDVERTHSDETCIIPNIYNEPQNVLDIAPGQNKTPE